jgi:ubiquinone/menaquinone biosynthesis C-methylase UbiE
MQPKDAYLAANKHWWEKMVQEGCGFCKPWLDLDAKTVKQFASGQLRPVPPSLNELFPVSVFADVEGKDVLCLASGGGQQSAVFGLLGAYVTVVDIAEGQLAGDQQAAKHYGYNVTTIQSDMSDLSDLADQSFDLVYQAPSMSYVPDVKRVYAEVARVLRPSGLYRADAQNPQSQFVDESSWDGNGYRITVPYAVKERKRAEDKEVYEYRHYLDETFNGLIESGFTIEHVDEALADLYQQDNPEPGSWEHSLQYINGIFAIVARKTPSPSP